MAEQRQPGVRHALLPRVEVGEVDVVEHEAVDRGAGRRGGAGDRLRDVVLALVHRLGGRGRRREPDLQLARLDSNLEDRQRVERRRAEHVAGSKIELRRMARADDDVALELTVRERALLVRAGVLKGDPALGGAAEADGRALDLDAAEEARRLRPPPRRRGAR